jgi:hypothetical protein
MRRTLSKEGRDRKHKRILGKQQSDKRTSMNSRTGNTGQPSSTAKGGGGCKKTHFPCLGCWFTKPGYG